MFRCDSWTGLCGCLSSSSAVISLAPGHGPGHVPAVAVCDDPPRLQHLLRHHQHVHLHHHHQVHRGADVPVHFDDHLVGPDTDIMAHCWNILVVTFTTEIGSGTGCECNSRENVFLGIISISLFYLIEYPF